jgi:N-acylglucosamine-6-phosphate 2-epimerase
MEAVHPVLRRMRGGLIVSCQPEAESRLGDPMNSPLIMGALARAAVLGGAVGIRADSPADISAVRAAVDVPLIGIFKRDIPGFSVRITPTLADALKVSEAGADVIAVDATARSRPEGGTAGEHIRAVKTATGKPVFADVATFEEGVLAQEAGADAVLPTLAGYAGVSAVADGPDFALLARLVETLRVPVIAEGGIATPAQATRALDLGAWAVCVGSAITRPRWITESFASALRRGGMPG